MLLLWVASAAGVHAQTAQESAAWLQARLRTYVIAPELAHANVVDEVAITTCDDPDQLDNGRYRALTKTVMRFADLTEITSRFRAGRDVGDGERTLDLIIVTLTGPSTHYVLNDGTSEEHSELKLWLLPDTPKDEIQRIIKAIKHLAILNGAKIPNDDLFK